MIRTIAIGITVVCVGGVSLLAYKDWRNSLSLQSDLRLLASVEDVLGREDERALAIRSNIERICSWAKLPVLQKLWTPTPPSVAFMHMKQ